MNNYAYDNNQNLIIVPLPPGPIFETVKKLAFTTFKMNAIYLDIKGLETKSQNNPYFDIRDI